MAEYIQSLCMFIAMLFALMRRIDEKKKKLKISRLTERVLKV